MPLVTQYHPFYANAEGVQTHWELVEGGLEIEYIGVIDGTENVPLYTGNTPGNDFYAGQQGDAAQFNLSLVGNAADLPAVGEFLWAWWPRRDGFAAGFFRCWRMQ